MEVLAKLKNIYNLHLLSWAVYASFEGFKKKTALPFLDMA